MPHIHSVIACRGEGPCQAWGCRAACQGAFCVRVPNFTQFCLLVCVRSRQLVWECDGQNETSPRKSPARRSIARREVYGPQPPLRTFVLVRVGVRGVGTSPRPPLIPDEVMSLCSTPGNVSRGCIIPLYLLGRGGGGFCNLSSALPWTLPLSPHVHLKTPSFRTIQCPNTKRAFR